MGKKKQHKQNHNSANGVTKSLQTDDATTNKRAKKRSVQYPTDVEGTSNGKNASAAKRPKKASKQTTTEAGWVVESGDCQLSKEGNTEFANIKSDKANNGDSKKVASSKLSPKLQTVAFKRKADAVDDNNSDTSEWTTDEEYGSSFDGIENGNATVDEYDDEDDASFDSSTFSSYDSMNSDAEEDSFESASFESASFDEDEDQSLDSSSSSDSNYRKYIYEQKEYDSDGDEDYGLTNPDDTIHVPFGSAVMHELPDDMMVQFDESITHGQIIELPLIDDNVLEKVDEPTEVKQVEKVEEDKKLDDKALDDVESEEASGSIIDNGLKKVDEPTEIKQVETVEEGKKLDDVESEKLGTKKKKSIIKPKPTKASDTSYTFYDAVDLRMSIVVLKAPIYVYGHLSVQVLCGKVEILGYTLDTAEKRTLYASEGYNAINITPVPSPATYRKGALGNICQKLRPHFYESDIAALVKQFDPAKGALVLLRADTFNASDTVPLVCKLLSDFNLFPTAASLDQTSPFSRTETLLEISLFQPAVTDVPLFKANPAWDTVQLKPDSRLMVVGGKGAGKSTLCQYLINRHIKHFGRILLVDLDIGQPLLSLPETISVSVVQEAILGVGCFANVQPEKCLFFGSLNVVTSPILYVQNVRSLAQYCTEHPELSGMPWIINTMGYVAGFGEELTTAIIRLLQPTDLIQLTFPKQSKKNTVFIKAQNYANQLKAELVNEFRFNILYEEVQLKSNPVNYRFHTFDVTYEPCKASFIPPQRRTILIMAQLVKILGDSDESFANVKPHMANVNDLQILITRDEHRPSKEMLLHALNASLVYLCEKDETGQYNCFGVGIVRSVDDKENVYLLHSLSPEQLARTNVLALCNTSLPSQVYLQPSPNIEGTIPYLHNMTKTSQ
ncbi:polynucleotide 5'-hydroxyl-kinase NOL9 [Anopheles funestus]|uniref:polynucleotide 5'-hydroxyl-kinase NOL9 n=1 Tax=Anopheles funestus TaxID=62324 RepID=UPI0020C5BEDB|nr:polynucleotide 5'-hydroxyl-kinase NOL9 [Anopheles funestus]